jgi:hypothetical protein
MSDEKRYGLFTEQQRKYLSGDENTIDRLSKDNERRIKNDIRKRVDTLFRELNLLVEISDEEREKIFESSVIYTEKDIEASKEGTEKPGTLKRKQERWESGGGMAMTAGLSNCIAFTYQGLREQGVLPEQITPSIAGGIQAGEKEVSDEDINVDIEVTFPSVNIEEAVKRLENGEQLRAEEMKALVDIGYADIQPSDE